MKKFITVAFAVILSLTAYAQKDTTIINSRIVDFDLEVVTSKTGEEKTTYLVRYKHDWYISDKTSYKRYVTALRFGVTPNMAIVEDHKTKAKKIIVL